MRIWPTWSSLSGQKKSGKRFSISKEEKGSWRPLYLLCRSSSCTRSSPSPASAPPSRAGSRPSTPPCPSPSQTRCIENSYSCIRLAHTEKKGKTWKIFLLFLYKSLGCWKLTGWWFAVWHLAKFTTLDARRGIEWEENQICQNFSQFHCQLA